MLTFSLGKHLIHALAFSPDGARLAVACGYRVAALDWQAPGEPVWHEPFQLSGPPESLGFRPDGPGVLVGYWNTRSYRGNPVYELDPLAGGIVERLPLTNSPRVSWATHMPVVVAWSDPPAVIALGYLAFPNPWHALVVPVVGGPPVARLGWPPARNPYRETPFHKHPRAAWVVGRNRLLVWSGGFLRWFRWPPPPPAPPPSRWQAFASAVTGVRPLPPDLEMLAEHPFPFSDDAVAPLPDGDTLLVAHKDDLVRWHAPTGTELARLRWPGMQALRSLAVSPDGTVAAVGGNGGRVIVWDLDV